MKPLSCILKSERAARIFFGILSGDKKIPHLSSEAAEANVLYHPHALLLPSFAGELLSFGGKGGEKMHTVDSDFERLETVLKILPEYSGSGYYSYARALFSSFGYEDVLPCVSDAPALWKQMNARLLSETVLPSQLDCRRVCRIEALPTSEMLKPFETANAYFDFLKEQIRAAEIAFFSMKLLSCFRAPDPYHAEQAYQLLRKGKDGEGMPFAYQIFRTVGEACRERDLPLLLTDFCDTADITMAIRYLERVERIPRLRVVLSDREDLTAAEESGLLPRAESAVLFTDDISLGNTALRELLGAIAAKYPIGKLSVCSGLRKEALPPLFYECCAARFFSALSELFSEWIENGDLENEAAAVLLGQKMLC